MFYTICEGTMGTKAAIAAIKLCKGSYQTNLIRGHESWSGSTLRGKAREWSMKYKESRTNLLKRLEAAQIPHHMATREHGKRVLILGIW